MSRIHVRGNVANGVVLDNGDEIRPHRRLQRRSSRDVSPAARRCRPAEDFADAVRRYRFRGASAKVNLALDALPTFTARHGGDAHLRGAISISPSVNYMERAYDEAKYGTFSRRPTSTS